MFFYPSGDSGVSARNKYTYHCSVVLFMMQSNSFLLYGANGYTGELIGRYAKEYNLQPILCGRRKELIEPLANKLQLPYRVFDINDTAALQAALKEVKAVINAAGPFQFTAMQMIEACLQTGIHYLDINEISPCLK
jgi:short subunit dehydrogenase-like uncharacterized protein